MSPEVDTDSAKRVRILARILAAAAVEAVTFLWIARLDVLPPRDVPSDSRDFAWNVVPVAIFANAVVCLLIFKINKQNIARVIVCAASSIGTLLISIFLFAPLLNSESHHFDGMKGRTMFLLGVIAIATVGWSIGCMASERFTAREPIHVPRFQFTLAELMIAMLLTSLFAGFISIALPNSVR